MVEKKEEVDLAHSLRVEPVGTSGKKNFGIQATKHVVNEPNDQKNEEKYEIRWKQSQKSSLEGNRLLEKILVLMHSTAGTLQCHLYMHRSTSFMQRKNVLLVIPWIRNLCATTIQCPDCRTARSFVVGVPGQNAL